MSRIEQALATLWDEGVVVVPIGLALDMMRAVTTRQHWSVVYDQNGATITLVSGGKP